MIDFADDAQDLIAGYRRFRAGRYREASDLFHRLRKGQEPATMIIACADSRADPAMIFDAAPGELFTVRNVAALVPPYEESGGLHGVSAALEFAVTRLRVKQIVVMGHGGCGGIAASLAAAADRPVGRFIAPWVEIAAEARDAVLRDESIPQADWQEAVERRAVGQSLINLMSFPFVRAALANGSLQLNGAWFSIGRGELHWRDPATGAFAVVAAEDAADEPGNQA
ncbi:MAG: carbonic anhydrase [Sinobacteraceae bacterium]|nr:carbonic anhydrase [Nevskiaceae bacterium]MCP5471451.1 carbonic anhydrase [Nevskiaceae bacterium]